MLSGRPGGIVVFGGGNSIAEVLWPGVSTVLNSLLRGAAEARGSRYSSGLIESFLSRTMIAPGPHSMLLSGRAGYGGLVSYSSFSARKFIS